MSSKNRYRILLDEGAPKPRKGLVIDRFKRYMPGSYKKTKEYVPPGKINGHNRCNWCGKEVMPPKRTFCSPECVYEWKLRTGGSLLRSRVERRDNGVCAQCGIDTYRLKRMLYPDSHTMRIKFLEQNGIPKTRGLYSLSPAKQAEWNRYCEKMRDRAERLRKRIDPVWLRNNSSTLSLWEADHIVPVAEGGGCCGVENMQTLCLRCHVAKPRPRKTKR